MYFQTSGVVDPDRVAKGVRDEEEDGGGDRLSEPMEQDRNSGTANPKKPNYFGVVHFQRLVCWVYFSLCNSLNRENQWGPWSDGILYKV